MQAKQLNGKIVLLFCPKFFNYEQEIKRTLESLGAKVIWFDDRPGNDFLSKALIRINKNFLRSKIKKYYLQVINTVALETFDYVFFVNPEAISKEMLLKFRATFPAAKFLLYMWDSFNNRKQNIELLPFFDRKFTFDPADAKQNGLDFRPLFYAKIYQNSILETASQFNLLFIGTAHSDRYRFVKKITKDISKHKLKLYFYLSSKLLFYTKRLVDKDFRNVSYGDISFESLSHADIMQLLLQSKAILDINHPQQIGLTMRTLETFGASRKLITTNADVVNYDFYHPNNIYIIDRAIPLIEESFFALPYETPDQKLLYKYSIEGWLTEIFS